MVAVSGLLSVNPLELPVLYKPVNPLAIALFGEQGFWASGAGNVAKVTNAGSPVRQISGITSR
jgi:hypothetical protein